MIARHALDALRNYPAREPHMNDGDRHPPLSRTKSVCFTNKKGALPGAPFFMSNRIIQTAFGAAYFRPNCVI